MPHTSKVDGKRPSVASVAVVLSGVATTPPAAAASATASAAAAQQQAPAVGGSDGGWDEAVTAEGVTYFYHRVTRAVRWDRPDVRPEVAQRMEERMKKFEEKNDKDMEQIRKEIGTSQHARHTRHSLNVR